MRAAEHAGPSCRRPGGADSSAGL